MRKPTKPCTVDGCDRLGFGGLCHGHQNRVRLTGQTGPATFRRMIPFGTTAADKIDIIGWTVMPSGCWHWNGRIGVRAGGHEYGRIDDENTVARLTHRIAYVKWVGPLEDDQVLMHICDNPICINPLHLRPGTQADNMHDMANKGRARFQKITHCKHGHEFTPENTKVWIKDNGRPSRKCIQCSRDNANRRYWANKSSAA